MEGRETASPGVGAQGGGVQLWQVAAFRRGTANIPGVVGKPQTSFAARQDFFCYPGTFTNVVKISTKKQHGTGKLGISFSLRADEKS